MSIMEFEDIKKIWDAQSNQHLYVINESAMQNRITKKKHQALHITNVTERLSIITNLAVGTFIAIITKGNIGLYLTAAWMILTGLAVLISRLRRTSSHRQFDRSVMGDLAHAISSAAYQVRLSFLLRWNIAPIAFLLLLAQWLGGKSVWATAGMVIALAIGYFVSGWEHNFYKRRLAELRTLQSKLRE